MMTLSFVVPALFALLLLAPQPQKTRSTEIHRIQRHFDGAIEMLQRADVSALSPAQRANRTALAAELARYRDRALFPVNYDFPGEAVPYFIDRQTGIRCAVGHLMEFTGHADLVARIAAANNNVWVNDLADDADVGAWLNTQGLTLAEAARIQVPYMGDPCFECGGQTSAQRNTMIRTNAVAITAALTSAMLPGAIAGASQSRVAGTFGMAIGLASLWTAGATWVEGSNPGVAAVTAASAGISIYTASRTFSRSRVARAAAAESRTRVALILPTSASQGTGLSLSIAF